MKGNEMPLQTIYILWFCGCGFSVVKASNFTEIEVLKRIGQGVSNNINGES